MKIVLVALLLVLSSWNVQAKDAPAIQAKIQKTKECKMDGFVTLSIRMEKSFADINKATSYFDETRKEIGKDLKGQDYSIQSIREEIRPTRNRRYDEEQEQRWRVSGDLSLKVMDEKQAKQLFEKLTAKGYNVSYNAQKRRPYRCK